MFAPRPIVLAALLAMNGCGRGGSSPSAPPEPQPAPHDATAVAPPPRPYVPSAEVRAVLEAPASLPATGTWPDKVLTTGQFDDAVKPLEDAEYGKREEVAAQVVSSLGTFALVGPRDRHSAGAGEYDAASGSLVYEGTGFRGLETRVMLAFEDDPGITIGSLPGPIGGHVSMSTGTIRLRLSMPAALAAGFEDRTLEQHYLVRPMKLGIFDDVFYLRTELLGYRLVDAADHTVYYDSLAAAP